MKQILNISLNSEIIFGDKSTINSGYAMLRIILNNNDDTIPITNDPSITDNLIFQVIFYVDLMFYIKMEFN